MVEATCICGSVRLEIVRAPDEVTDCNCSLCRRYGVLWAYYSPKDVRVTGGPTEFYVRGDRGAEFHRCKACGCVTHYVLVDASRDRMAVNARLLPPEVLATARLRPFDGAETWTYLDE